MFRIYIVTNKINGKIYIGQTGRTIDQRWYEHIKDAQRINNTYFYKAIRKYGSENFTVKEIDYTENGKNHAIWLESFYIGATHSYKPEIGYNSSMGGEGNIPNEETRLKMSNSHKGKKLPAEQKIKIGLSLIGHKLSDETKQKISERLITEEFRQKMSVIKTNRIVSDETKEKCKLRKGEKSPVYRHDITIANILPLLNDGYSYRTIAKKLGTSHGVISARVKTGV